MTGTGVGAQIPRGLNQESRGQFEDLGWNGLCRVGGVAAYVLLVYCLATLVQLVVLGGQPKTAVEAFELLQRSKLIGLLRLDFPTILAIPLYYILFLGIFAALRRVDRAYAALATILAFVGTTLVLATPTALPMLSLSERYAAAKTEAVRVQIETVGEAILATDIWHNTGAFMGGILLLSGAVLVCALMLRSEVFGQAIAWVGIVTHGLDLAHIAIGIPLPTVSFVLMATAGPVYLIWFFLIGRRLLQLAKRVPTP
jgi:hypothetical protein